MGFVPFGGVCVTCFRVDLLKCYSRHTASMYKNWNRRLPCLHHKYATVLQTQGRLLLSSGSALLPFSARQRLNHLSTQHLSQHRAITPVSNPPHAQTVITQLGNLAAGLRARGASSGRCHESLCSQKTISCIGMFSCLQSKCISTLTLPCLPSCTYCT